MIIAVNTRLLLDEPEGNGYFIREMFQLIVRKHPEHQFHFLFDRPFNENYVFSSNVTASVVSPPARLPVLWKYWYDVKIPFVLKKVKADVFISPDGYCSLTTNLPQCIVVHDLGFLHQPEGYKKTHVRFLKKYTPKFLRKAKQIVTVSKFSKDDIVKHYKIDPAKIDIVYNGVKSVFRPLADDQKKEVKEKFTEGAEYFIYVGAIHPRKNLVNLLKAFSIFKKRLQSNMKLVIAGRLAWKNKEFLKLINTYKYKNDVVLTGYLPEENLALLLASSYALVYPSLFEGFGVPIAEAMRCNVPVLTSSGTSMEEIAGEAALYFNPTDHADIAEKIMLIYKDEGLRKQLIEKGEMTSDKYDWEKLSELFWQSILKTVEN
jgi:glycosyltransferase involved in cell wall biosynthesis